MEFKIALPEGLTYTGEYAVTDSVFAQPFFNGNMKYSSMGTFGKGYTGSAKLPLVSFVCKVDAGVVGDLVLTVVDDSVVLTKADTQSFRPSTKAECVVHICGALENVAEVPATCTTDGVKAHQKCSCGQLWLNGKVVTLAELRIPALGHKIKVVGYEPATCTKEGYTGDKYCEVCGELVEKGKVIPMLEHEIEIRGAEEATCIKEGYTGDKYCKVCGELIEKGQKIGLQPHEYSDWRVTKEVNCGVDGERTRTCICCGATETEVIPATGEHTWSEWQYNDDEHWHTCLVCGQVKDHGPHEFRGDDTCDICGFVRNSDPPAPTGSFDPKILLAVLAVLAMAGAAVIITKRKTF